MRKQRNQRCLLAGPNTPLYLTRSRRGGGMIPPARRRKQVLAAKPTRLFDLPGDFDEGYRYAVGGDASRFLVLEPMTRATHYVRPAMGWHLPAK